MTTELPGDPVPAGPALDLLVNVLTGAPGEGELDGEAAVLAMYRAVRQPGPVPVLRHRHRARTLAAAAVLALAGCIGAAYAAILPAQVQHAAYQVLGFIGVPDARHQPPSHPRPAAGAPATSPAPSASQASPGSRSPGTASASSSASAQRNRPAASPATRLTIALRQRWIAAGSSDEINAELTGQGRPVAGQLVRLLRRDAGPAGWQPAGQMLTSPEGNAALATPAITVNTWFRLTGPDRTQSQAVLVIVVPRVSVAVTAGPGPRTDVLTVSCQYAAPGDVVLLQVRTDGFWESARSHRLGPGPATTFTIRVPAAGQRVLRAVLLATVSHGLSASEPVIVTRS